MTDRPKPSRALREELERLGRMCKLLDLYMSEGVPAVLVTSHLEGTRALIERVLPQLAVPMMIKVGTAFGPSMGALLAEIFSGEECPDFPPEDW